MKKILFLLLLLWIFSTSASSHSGRTDAQGGHYNRKTGEYHFHNNGNLQSPRPTSQPSPPPVTRLPEKGPRQSIDEIFDELLNDVNANEKLQYRQPNRSGSYNRTADTENDLAVNNIVRTENRMAIFLNYAKEHIVEIILALIIVYLLFFKKGKAERIDNPTPSESIAPKPPIITPPAPPIAPDPAPDPEPPKKEEPAIDKFTLIEKLALYVILHSTKKRFSHTKLNNYIVLMNRQFNLGFTESTNIYGKPVILELPPCVKTLTEEGLIFEEKPKIKSGKGYKNVYISIYKTLKLELSEDVKNYLDDLIKKYDNTLANTMLK